MSEILNVTELAAFLKVSKRHIHELTKDRTRSGEVRRHPLPVLRIGTSLRFRKNDIEAWLQRLAESQTV
jgi:excisionase family DNA binding protein